MLTYSSATRTVLLAEKFRIANSTDTIHSAQNGEGEEGRGPALRRPQKHCDGHRVVATEAIAVAIEAWLLSLLTVTVVTEEESPSGFKSQASKIRPTKSRGVRPKDGDAQTIERDTRLGVHAKKKKKSRVKMFTQLRPTHPTTRPRKLRQPAATGNHRDKTRQKITTTTRYAQARHDTT